MDRIILIDAYGQIYRSFFAVPHLTNPKGEPVNALYGMVRFLLNLEETLEGKFGAAAFDLGKCRRRCELLPEYKAQRPPMPDDLRRQIEPIKIWLQALGWPLLLEEGREADDLIAAVVARRENRPVAIISYDKDLSQLVAEEVEIITPEKKGQWSSCNRAAVTQKFGIGPELLADYLALVGDSSDNIPGLTGVGPKTAAKLLQQFGGLEEIYRNLAQVTPLSLQEKLSTARELLQRNRELVRLDCTLPAGWQGLDSIRRREPDWALLCRLATEQGFQSILNTLNTLQKKNRGAQSGSSEQLLLF